MPNPTPHTPTPWTLEPGSESVKVDGRTVQHRVIRNDDYLWLALVNDEELDNGKENAAHIVRCVNERDALIEALENYLADTDGIVSLEESDKCACCGHDYIDEHLKAAEEGKDFDLECRQPHCARVQAFQVLAKAKAVH